MIGSSVKCHYNCFIKLNTHLFYGPAIPLLGIYPRETKTYVHKKTCTRMVHFSFIQNSQKLGTAHVSIDGYLGKLTWWIPALEYYTASKKEPAIDPG